MKKAPTKEEVFGHRSLAYELLNAECAMKSISLNLSSLRFANHRKFKKETLKNTERLYSEIRTLRESIGNEFQKLFEGREKYDTPRLHYAYRGDTIKEIDELLQNVSLCVQFEMDCGDSSQDIIPF
jgi:hypothetical protein